jgi:glutamate-ammonia-ligase adenylyltransferase
VIDTAAAARLHDTLSRQAANGGWADALEQAWPALAPAFAASPYLAGLARKAPERLGNILAASPEASLAAILAETGGWEAHPVGLEEVSRGLRRLKADLHLTSALADLGGVWDLDQVTGALSDFADAALRAALATAARAEMEKGRLVPGDGPENGPVPGLFVLAMGKHGARELNYSSDIDISFFYEPDQMPLAPGVEAQAEAVRLTQLTASVLGERTADGYVFRTDLRLRPDPAATPAAVPAPAALDYYETVGQNWERAAFIKARVAGGDPAAGVAFLKALQPFVWRRSLDYAAIADIQSIKRQIHAYKADERLTAAGADLKLGRGGIREIEFFVQTQQLIFGGREPELRSSRTVEALRALARTGHVASTAAEELAADYGTLRGLEHRAQMIDDAQTHRLPEDIPGRRRIAALSGFSAMRSFDAHVARTLKRVNRRYGELFAEEEPLSSPLGSLVFTGVEDDPETLQTLSRMGFEQPAQVSAAIRGWHHGRIAATRTARGRELFTRLAPRLLEAARSTGAPDAAFNRFADFFSGLTSGVQVQSLFLAEPKLFETVVRVMAFAPDLARTLSRRPAALDALLDSAFLAPLSAGSGLARLIETVAASTSDLEGAMDAVRRVHREQAFRVGVQVLTGVARAEAAGEAFADLADACIGALSTAALREVERQAGTFPGAVAVVALGKAGSREMTARSDLDLMTLYAAEAPVAASAGKGWGAETFYGRFTQRLIAALSAPTGEGTLYPVDLQLRPSGAAGPVAVSLTAFERYYEVEAETWEMMALTRARVVWASDHAFSARAAAAVETALRRARNPADLARDAREMRALMEFERPAEGFWDFKLSRGGLVDVEFAAQTLQLVHAFHGGPLRASTVEALGALAAAGLAPATVTRPLARAWALQQNLSQLVRVALAEGADPAQEPPPFQAMLARAGGARDLKALAGRVGRARAAARRAYDRALGATEGQGQLV